MLVERVVVKVACTRQGSAANAGRCDRCPSNPCRVRTTAAAEEANRGEGCAPCAGSPPKAPHRAPFRAQGQEIGWRNRQWCRCFVPALTTTDDRQLAVFRTAGVAEDFLRRQVHPLEAEVWSVKDDYQRLERRQQM